MCALAQFLEPSKIVLILSDSSIPASGPRQSPSERHPQHLAASSEGTFSHAHSNLFQEGLPDPCMQFSADGYLSQPWGGASSSQGCPRRYPGFLGGLIRSKSDPSTFPWALPVHIPAACARCSHSCDLSKYKRHLVPHPIELARAVGGWPRWGRSGLAPSTCGDPLDGAGACRHAGADKARNKHVFWAKMECGPDGGRPRPGLSC